jgi:4-amino-4-deoxy-L-arabinose transferase-like glycosyltransferase
MTRKLTALLSAHWPILLLLALFAAVYSASLTAYGMLRWDEAEYASIGRSVLHGEGFSISAKPNPLRPPLLPLAGAAAMLVTGENDTALRMTGCALALLTVLSVYAAVAAASDRVVAVVAAALLGMSPFFWTFIPFFMCEIPFMAFFSLAVWLFYLGAHRHERFFVWSWICWALAFLTRYTAWLFVPVIAAGLPLALWLGGKHARSRIMTRAFWFAPAAGALVLLPWIVRQSITFHDPLAGIRVGSQQLQLYYPEQSPPWHYYLDRMPTMFSMAAIILVLVGLIWGLRARDSFVLHNVLAAAIVIACFSCYRYKEDRLVSSALPFLAAIAAVGLARLAALLRTRLQYAAIALVLVGIFARNFTKVQPVFDMVVTNGYPSFLDAMAYLREQAKPGALVLGANYPQIFWYSGLSTDDFPEEDELLSALHRTSWVVITDFERGQKPYVSRLAERIEKQRPRDARRFWDRQYATIVLPAGVLLELLAK